MLYSEIPHDGNRYIKIKHSLKLIIETIKIHTHSKSAASKL